VDYAPLEKRLADIRGRGVVLRDGQSLHDLYLERKPLYERYADVRIAQTGLNVEQSVSRVMEELKQFEGIK
jgi:shikimate kinase